ncbi:MAG: energy transducer TonB, partial [Novosphingobium sp.]
MLRPGSDRRLLAAALAGAIHAGGLALLLLWHFNPVSLEAPPALTVVELPDRPERQPPPPPPPPPA